MGKDYMIEGETAARTKTRSGVRISAWALWAVLGLGSFLRLITLGRQSLWLDEAVTFWTVNRSFADLLDYLGFGFRPLFFLVLYPFASLSGHEVFLRLPSALAGIGSIYLIYRLGQEMFGQNTGLLAALLLALSPLHIWYSQEARFYALVGFWMVAAVLFAVLALKGNRIRDWFLFGLFEGLALWTESAALWFVLAVNGAALLMLVSLWRRRQVLAWAASQLLAVMIYLPAIPGFFNEAREGGNTLWIPTATLLVFARVVSDFTGGFFRSRAEGLLILLLVAAALLVGARWLYQESREERKHYILLLCWLVVPLALSFFISQEYFRPALLQMVIGERKSVFLTRNLITVIFPLLLLVARSLVLLPMPGVRTAITAGLVSLYLIGYLGNTIEHKKENYREAAEAVAGREAPGDIILTSPGYIEQPFAYYYHSPRPYGVSLESVRDGVVASLESIDGQIQSASGLDYVYQSQQEALSGHSRAWLVTNTNIFQEGDAELAAYLEENGQLVEAWMGEGVRVQLFELAAVEGQQP